MKKSPALVFLTLILATACAPQQSPPERGEVKRVSYHCANGEHVELQFFPQQDRAVLVRHGTAIELAQQPAASGFLYSNGPNTVRGKGQELQLEIGRMVPIHCTAH